MACIGPTRCGKTSCMRCLLAAEDNTIILDPKYRWKWVDPNIPATYALVGPRYEKFAFSFEELVRMLLANERDGSGAPIVYKPPADHWQQKNIAKIDRVYELAFKRGGTTVYNDEQYFATPYTSNERATNAMPHWFQCVVAGGASQVRVMAGFQRTTGVPLITLTETDLRIVFNLRWDDDRARAEQLCGEVDWPTLQAIKYSFLWATDIESSAPMKLRSKEPGEPALAHSA